MNPDIVKKFEKINVWKRGSERAPHKPLLILYMLGRYSNDLPGRVPYREIDEKLRSLLVEFGPFRKTYHPEFPFWYLQNDGLWVIEENNMFGSKGKGSNPSRNELLKNNIHGSFPEKIDKNLKNNKELIHKIATSLLETHFPDSLHDDILNAVGLDPLHILSKRRKRNHEFRGLILKAYEYKCTICGFDIKLHKEPVGLEAAHIKWHQAGGPDKESNGVALCTMHHKLFDRGALTISESLRIRISEYAHGGKSFEEWLQKFNGKKITPPINFIYYPEIKFVNWHVREVFKGPSRVLY